MSQQIKSLKTETNNTAAQKLETEPDFLFSFFLSLSLSPHTDNELDYC